MLFKLLEFIKLCLPFGVLIWLYKHNKALPANIRTRTGKMLKAIMITPENGILFTEKKYIENRVKVLKHQQEQINQANKALANELNSLSFEARELFVEEDE